MAKAKRVFELARELGVQSKAILDKCQAEEIDLHNHMSTISIGLEATIRDWFSENHAKGGGTAVETAEAVDLSKVRAKSRRKANTGDESDTAAPTDASDADGEAAPDAGVTVAPSPSEPEVVTPAATTARAKPRHRTEPVAEPHTEPIAAPASPPPSVKAPEPTKPPVDSPGVTAAAAKAAEPAAPEAPPSEAAEPVRPAGPKLEQPGAAKLRGPKLVRMEEPEPDQRRRGPRRGPGGPGSTGQQSPDFIPTTGPQRGRGVGKPTPGGASAEEEAARSPRRKRARKGRQSSDAELWDKGVRREQDLLEREARLSHAAGYLKQRRRQMKARSEGGIAMTAAETGGRVAIAEPFTIKDLSAATGLKGADIVKFLFQKGVIATINHTISADLAIEACLEYDIELEVKEARSAEDEVKDAISVRTRTDVRRRPPVVAVLGHVDHGKTSLLDRIRTADVAAGEAGGITQHIGAFRTTIKGGDGTDKTVVFLDTPGHFAFSNMRARGATLADLVVLVVAADDGVMPQTIESINHAKAAGTTIVVALNKCDLPQATEANIRRIHGQLAEHGLNPSEWGGTTEVMKVSATTGEGITELIEVLDYQAELKELTADYAGHAYGTVIEAELDPGRGSIARVLVQEGELRVGDFIVIGRAFGKVRSMIDDKGAALQIAGPATPIEISGINDVPDAGDRMYVTDTLTQSEEIATHRRDKERKKELAAKSKVSLDNIFEQAKQAGLAELRMVLKADVQGSVEVLRKTLEEQGTDQVRTRVLHAAVGGITESDVVMAEASNAVVIGFNVIASAAARNEAERRGVDVRLYRIIYDIVDDVRKALEGMLAPERREEVLGHAEVREVFRVSKVGNVAGCYVTDGVVRRNALIRVTRDGIVVEHDRTLEQLKRFKDDAKEVRNGMECGMKIDGYDDIRAGDVLECYITTEVKAKLS